MTQVEFTVKEPRSLTILIPFQRRSFFLMKREAATLFPTAAASLMERSTASGWAASQAEATCSDSKKSDCSQKVARTHSLRSAGMMSDITLDAGARCSTAPAGVTTKVIG